MTPGGWVLKEARPIFSMLDDPRPGHGVLGVSDPDVHHLDGRWTMFLGAVTTRFSARIVQAHLPPDVPVSTDSWRIARGHHGGAVTLGEPPDRRAWDAAGMHSPSYVRGFVHGTEVERIYYAGQLTRAFSGSRSRYAIGFLERRADGWRRGSAPVLTGDRERPSVLEPFVLYTGGRWHMWFLSTVGEVGRGKQPDYELRHTESADGTTWSGPERFSGGSEGFFDNAVQPISGGWRMIIARGTNLYGTKPYPPQGLWITESDGAVAGRTAWSPVERLLDTEAAGEDWYGAGVCGPAVVEEGRRLHVFATGTHSPTGWGRAAWERLRQAGSPPPPAPFFLTTGRFTFERVSPVPHPTHWDGR